MSIYLDRYAYHPLAIETKPAPNIGIIVVMPVFNEQHTLTALNSLIASALPNPHVEVIIVINQAVDCEPKIATQNRTTFNEVESWIKSNHKEGICFFVKHINLANKHAGVGLARKAGMDEAVRRFETVKNDEGIILCFDADCVCSSNYLKEVYSKFNHPKLKAASINFEHNLNSLVPFVKEGIGQYELHLRYYVNGLRKAGYPYAFHTIGSSMAVRTDIYKKAGGMNRRKAGEDFHFLHKVIPYGNYDEITSVTVFPSARISERVPFGTGKAMGDWLNQNKNQLLSYNPQIFSDIATLLHFVPKFYKNKDVTTIVKQLPVGVQDYLDRDDFEAIVKDITRQSSSMKVFIHRWFGWFNGLKALHLVHYLRDHIYPSIPVIKAAKELIDSDNTTTNELLEEYRRRDKKFTANQISLIHLYSEHL